MMKKILVPLSFVLVLIVLLGFVNLYHNYNIGEEASATLEEQEIQNPEKQAIYEKNKGAKLVYFVMGDSLAVGADATTKDERYVSALASMIEEKMGYNVIVDDSTAKSGTGVRNNGLPNVYKLLAARPDFITIGFGTNDMNKKLSAYSTPEEFRENLSKLIGIIKSGLNYEPKIILMTTWNRGEKSIIYDQIIKEVGEKFDIPVADISSVWARNDTFGPKGVETYRGESDNWHPNDLGHQLIAETFFKIAYELLR